MQGQADVLILAEYDEIGALMAALVELSGHRPVFPLADEVAPDAVRRLRPGVVLLEWEHEQAGSAALARATAACGAVTLLFSPAQSTEELEQVAARCGLRAITFPLERSSFRASLNSAITSRRHSA